MEGRAMAQIRHGFTRPLADIVLPTVDAVVADLRPTDPLLCLRPAAIAAAARRFTGCFPGDVLYAVKCNPEPRVLRALWAGGVRHFDCASLAEVRLTRKLLPAAEVHFMHPVKARPAIAEAFHRWGVTDFVFDSADELAKIVQETVPVGLVGDPPMLGLIVRLALPKGGAVYDLSGKFGAPPDEAALAGRPGPMPRASACRSMSARKASTRRLMRGRWRSPPMRSRRLRFPSM
jgi:ornithine decarboxylase